MRLAHERPAFGAEIVPDLLVVHPLVNHLRDLPPSRVRHAAAVRVATRQRIEVAGADVVANLAGAVDACEEPFDAFFFGALAANVGWIVAFLNFFGWGGHF